MSWYCRRPRVKSPPALVPKTSSPLTEQQLDKAKDAGPSKSKNKKLNSRARS